MQGSGKKHEAFYIYSSNFQRGCCEKRRKRRREREREKNLRLFFHGWLAGISRWLAESSRPRELVDLLLLLLLLMLLLLFLPVYYSLGWKHNGLLCYCSIAETTQHHVTLVTSSSSLRGTDENLYSLKKYDQFTLQKAP